MSLMNISSQEIYGDVIALTLITPPHTIVPIVVESQVTSTNLDHYGIILRGSAKLYDPNDALVASWIEGTTDDTFPMTYERGVYTFKVGAEETEHVCFSKLRSLIIREELKMIAGESVTLENKKCILVAKGEALLNGVAITGPYIVGVHSPTVQVVATTDCFVIGIK